MKTNWQKFLALMCAMTLALTGLAAVGFASEAPAEEAAPAAEEQIAEVPAEEPAPAVAETEPAPAAEPESAPAAEEPVAVAPVETAPAAPVEEPAPAPAAEPAPAPAEPAPAEEPAPAAEDVPNEVPAQETVPAEEIAPATEAPAAEPTPAAEVPAEAPATQAPTETPVQEQIPADLTLKTLKEGNGTAGAKQPFIIRLVSNVTGKVRVTLKAASELFVQFGKDGEEVSREILPNEDGDVSFTFGAEYDKSYLLYVYSIGVNAETGLVIESAPFQISSEKEEPVVVPTEEPVVEETPAEEVPAEELTEVEVPAEEIPAVETDSSEEEIAEEESVSVEEVIPAEDADTETTINEEIPAEESSEEDGLVVYEQPDDEAEEETDEYQEALALYEVQYIVLSAETDIRTEADGMSPIMLTLPEGTALKGFVTDDPDWMLVAVDEQLGYIYRKDLITPEEETEEVEEEPEEQAEVTEAEEPVEAEQPEKKVTIFTSRRVSMNPGELVYLTSELEGFDGYEIMYQWMCDKGEGFQPVEDATEDTYSFTADVESLSWGWKLLVYYR